MSSPIMDSSSLRLPSSGKMADSAGWIVAGGVSFQTAARPGLEALAADILEGGEDNYA